MARKKNNTAPQGLFPNKEFCSRSKESGPFGEGSVLLPYSTREKRAG